MKKRSKINKLYNKIHSRVSCLNTLILKLIAIAAMTIDHIALVMGSGSSQASNSKAVLIPDGTYTVMRCIGRIAFPIFCYLLVEGYFHTRSKKKYALRLLIFAFISQIPFCLMLYSEPYVSGGGLNVFFTLLLGFSAIICLDAAISEYKTRRGDYFDIVFGSCAALIIIYAADWLKVDYGSQGAALIILFYLFRGRPLLTALSLSAILIEFSSPIEMFGLLALIPIFLYNGKRGPGLKYFFYAYYPLHMLVLYFVGQFLI